MAPHDRSSLLLALLLLLLLHSASAFTGRKVGGRAAIEDVETNREVQDLGYFAVDEYNRGLLIPNDRTPVRLLTFSRVVAAERQVVSGIKYYLRVEAREDGSGLEARPTRTFDALVVVKPWLRARTLVSFAPRSAGDGTWKCAPAPTHCKITVVIKNKNTNHGRSRGRRRWLR